MPQVINNSVFLHGFVSGLENRTMKSGKQFWTFKIQDYPCIVFGSIDFINGSYVFANGHIKLQEWQDKKYIRQITLTNIVKIDKKTQGIVELPPTEITPQKPTENNNDLKGFKELE